jgi:ADP-heptose:LPS heptosyltransferase
MHLLESYAVSCGAQIGECFIQEEEIPLPPKKYMTFHGINPKGSSRQYRYWQEVINLLLSDIFDLEIVQIGTILDHRFDHINTNYLGKTSYGSLAYLIKNAHLHLGFDSLPVHIASHYDIKIVAIYSHYSSISGPYFSSAQNIQILEPSFDLIKPSYSYNDPNDLIQNISPTSIHKALISLLTKDLNP